MSEIGNYIHYKKANYRQYGTFKDGDDSNYSSASKIFAEQKQAIKKRLPSTTSTKLGELETFLNGMMYGKDDISEADLKAMKELQNRVSKVFEEHYSNFTLSFGKGMHVNYKHQNKTNNSRAALKTLEKYLKTIEDMANGIIKLNKKGDINKINATMQSLEAFINANSDKKMINFANDSTASNLMKDINEVLKMQSIPTALAIGDAFEYWLAIASQYAGAKTVKIADDLIIDELVKGGDRSNPIISLNNFSDEYVSIDDLIASGAFSPDWKPINDNTAFKFNKPTQDKLDMVFNWDGDELKVSAKNYKLQDSSSMIHLVSGTSLLYLISTEDADFVNHWLNSVTISNKSEFMSTRLLQSAHIAMKLTIFAKALTGLDTSATGNTSDTFILNHRTKQHIYVRSAQEVFDNVETILNDDMKGIRFSGYPDRIPNVWVGNKNNMSEMSAQQRITNLIASLHKYNISVSMSPSVVTS